MILDIMIITTKKLHSKIESQINQEKFKLKIEIVIIHEDDNDKKDSAEALLKVYDRIMVIFFSLNIKVINLG